MATTPPVKPKTARPLTKDQWSKRKDKGKWSYEKYRTWWAKNQGQRISKDIAPSGAFQQQSPQQLGSLFNSMYPDFSGALLTPQQMQAQAGSSVSSMIDPIIQQLTDSVSARSKHGSAAIEGFTKTAENRLGGLAGTVESDYARLKGEQAGIDRALGDFLGGRTDNAAAGLEQQYAQIGGDPMQAQVLRNLGAGIEGESAALGSAALSRLVGSEAADLGFARKAPGFARAQGAQQLGLFQGELNRMLEEGTGEIRSQVPGLVESMYQRLLDRDLAQRGMKQTRAGAGTSFLNAGLDRNFQMSSLEASLKQRAQEMGISLGSDIMSAGGSGDDLVGDTGLTTAQITELQQQATAAGYEDAQALAAAHIDEFGNPLPGRKPIQYNQAFKQVYNAMKGYLEGYVPDERIRQLVHYALKRADIRPMSPQDKTKSKSKRGDPGTGRPNSSVGKRPPGTTVKNGAAPPAATPDLRFR